MDRRVTEAGLHNAAYDMYDALWEVIELSDRNQTKAGITPENQRVYDVVRNALAKAENFDSLKVLHVSEIDDQLLAEIEASEYGVVSP